MDSIITRTGGIFYYDAYRDQYDTTIIQNLSGTPSISSNKLLVNNCDIATFTSCVNSQVEISMSIPVAPVAAQDKVFGIQAPAQGNRGAAVFVISGSTFSAKVYNAAGDDTLFNETITWSSAWTATDVRYRIQATERNVIFLIEDTIVANFGSTSNLIFKGFAHNPLPVRITNNNADNLLLSSISIY